MKKLSLVILLLLTSGCASAQFRNFPEQREQNTIRIYDAAYDRTLDAVSRVLEEQGYPLKQIDKTNGIVETGEKTFTFGIMLAQKTAYAHVKKLSETRTEVRLNLRWSLQDSSGEERHLWKDYQELFEAIDRILK